MDKLDEYLRDLRDLREGKKGFIPTFSVKDGRTGARVLFLFQDPGKSGAERSRVVDRDNDDPSARTFKALNDEVGLRREDTVSWNTIPWAMQDTFPRELARVREWKLVPKLLDALPEVEVVVLCGTSKAHRLTVDVYAYGGEREDRDLLVLHGPHPSNLGLGGREGFTREQRKRWLRKVIEQARDHIACA